MPFINIKLGDSALNDTQRRSLIKRTTELMAAVMGKRAQVTVVLIESLPYSQWGIGGQPVTDKSPMPAYVEIKITYGTNSDAEKSKLISEVKGMLTEFVGTIAEATYVVIQELDADNWGYDGVTQAARKKRQKVP